MRAFRPIRKHGSEAGIALLIAIFVLLLIAVVAIALVVSSGTESALAGNYRSSTGVYYAALAGVEEARARMQPKDPNSFQNTWPAFYPAPGTTLPVGTVGYVLNPSPGDNAGAMLTTYPDTEYDTEFGAGALAAANAAGTVFTTPSVWNQNPLSGLPFPGPLYRWVRINAISEKSLNLDVDADNQADSITPLYYDSTNRVFSNNPGAGPQALELTALAVLPNLSQKILQYVVAPKTINLPPFPAAITLLGNNVDYSGPFTTSWIVSGNDSVTLGNCNPGPAVWAIGYTNNTDGSRSSITVSGAVATSPYKNNYTGQGGTIPNVGYVGPSIPASFQSPSQLDNLVQNITNIADTVIPGPATGSNLPNHMSPSELMTIVVNGNLDLTGWHNTGYGLLLVTGNLTYDPDASWYGTIFVIGQGYMTGARAGTGQIVGGLFLAKTRDTSGTLFPDPNLPSSNGTAGTYGTNIQFDNSMGGEGVYYSSCWIQAAVPRLQYKILSFHEISQ